MKILLAFRSYGCFEKYEKVLDTADVLRKGFRMFPVVGVVADRSRVAELGRLEAGRRRPAQDEPVRPGAEELRAARARVAARHRGDAPEVPRARADAGPGQRSARALEGAARARV